MKSSPSNTAPLVFAVNTSTSTGLTLPDQSPQPRRVNIKVKTKDIKNAVYTYIRAIRTLGRKELNTSEIADALSIPVEEVNRVVVSLKKKGVKKS